MDHHAFVAVARSKYRQALQLMQGEKMKGIKVLIELAK